MKILFDLTATQPDGGKKRHGGARYGEIVLAKILERQYPVACYYDSRKWLNPEMQTILDENNVMLYDIAEQSLSEIHRQSGCDRIYSALPRRELFNYKGCEVIGTIHGLRTLEMPADTVFLRYRSLKMRSLGMLLLKKMMGGTYKRFLVKYKQKELLNGNFRFVTVSYHSQCAIKAYFPSMAKKEIPVFYSPSTSADREIDRKYTDKYFLCVSARVIEKNVLRAIMAVDKLFDDGYVPDYKVKIAGAESADIFRYKIHNPEKFEFLGYVPDEELDQLYHDAYALVYPSLNEGFGYPPLEAMHYGVPVLASPFTSIPEVCQGAALYFNPASIEEIAARILRITDTDVRKEYSERAKSQYAKITRKQKDDLEKFVDYLYR